MQLDGSESFTSMISGYPLHRRLGEKGIYQLRFPKFTSQVLYDPYVTMSANFYRDYGAY